MRNDDLTRTVQFVTETYRKLNEIEKSLDTVIYNVGDKDAVAEGYARTARQQVKEAKAWIADRAFNDL